MPKTDMEKLQKTDHDTLIRVESKVDGLISDIKDLKDGTNMKLGDHEGRIRGIEKLVDATQPTTALNELHANTEWISEFKTRWKTIQAIWIAITIILSTVLTILSIKTNILGR